MGLPGLARQTFTVSRESSATDDEGHAWGTWADIGTYTGSWGTPRSSDFEIANRRGDRINAVVATETYLDAQPGDRIDDLQGKSWTVVSVVPLPVVSHVRVMLREVD